MLVRSIEPPLATFDAVELESPIDPLPEVPILDRDHLAVALPVPAVFAPIVQAVS